MIEYDISNDVCTLRLKAGRLNAITFELLEELCRYIRRANSDDDVRLIVITGSEHHFSAGADVNIFKDISSAEEAIETSRVFQEAFGFVEKSAKPVIAAVAGNVMGSALELAMACHYRICNEKTKFSMPEIGLGINPGAGGTQRLPRLVGAEAALGMLLTAKTVNAKDALQMGLVDSVCVADDFLADVRGVRKNRESFEKIDDAAVNEAAFVRAEKIIKTARPEVIAGAKILEAVKTGIAESFEAGLRKEQEVFAECMETQATRNKIYLFFATPKTSKVEELEGIEAAKINRAAVVGMGSMGTGIVHALIIAGFDVVVRDEGKKALEKGVAKITKSIEKRISAGKMSTERGETMLTLITTTTKWADISDADIVIEAVFEDVSVKQSALAEIETVCSAKTIVATNTSTLSLDTLSEKMAYPDRLIGLHFFNPAQVMPLVEVIRRESTSPEVIAGALRFTKQIRKTPVLVRNREGFIVNRIFIPYFKEAFYLLEDGASVLDIDEAMVNFGFPMGPLTLIDMAGLDILEFTDELMRNVFEHHNPRSDILTRLVVQGCLGQKTGSGLYKYVKGDYTRHDNPEAQKIIADVRNEKKIVPSQIGRDEIAERLILRMVNEAYCVMDEGVAVRQSDIDVAMVLGTGFPDFRGGVLKYAGELGIETVKERLGILAEKFGKRFKPNKYLLNMKGK